MDPQACWRDLATFYGEDWARAAELAEAMLEWLAKGGAPPDITGNCQSARKTSHPSARQNQPL